MTAAKTYPFPPVDFRVPPEDAYGRYELLTGIGPDDVTASPYEQVSSAFVNLERRLGRHPEFPRAHTRAIVADVCRDDWLFEIESDALEMKRPKGAA